MPWWGLTCKTVYWGSGCLVLQALTIRPAMCWWLWSSSPLTLLRVFIWIEKKRTWELVTRSEASCVYVCYCHISGSRYSAVDQTQSLWCYFDFYSCCDLWLHFSQGLMFGYATDETEECMPLTIVLAHKLNAKMAELRRNGTLPWLRPDSKTQVRQGNISKTMMSSHQILYSCKAWESFRKKCTSITMIYLHYLRQIFVSASCFACFRENL